MVYLAGIIAREPNPGLVEAAAAGDPDALAVLYRMYRSMVTTTAQRVAGNDEDTADDICQEAWLSAALRIRKLRHTEYFPAWLHRITLNAAYQLFRSEARRKQREGIYAAARPSAGEDFSNYVLLCATVDRVLAPGEKEVLTRIAQGATHLEVARQTGVCVGTSKSQLFKARKRLAPHFA
jgi:RNA polymerase sigma-70 factor, ECF subfamily